MIVESYIPETWTSPWYFSTNPRSL